MVAPGRRPATARRPRRCDADFAYEGDATCAGDSMCATSCPVADRHGRAGEGDPHRGAVSAAPAGWPDWTARHLGRRHGRRPHRAAPRAAAPARCRCGARVAGRGHRLRPPPGPVRRPAPASADRAAARAAATSRASRTAAAGAPVVVLPSGASRACWARCPASREPVRCPRCSRARASRWSSPPRPDALCCGMPFASKGYPEAARVAARRTFDALWSASDGGRLAVVTDASPCAGALQDHARHASGSGRCASSTSRRSGRTRGLALAPAVPTPAGRPCSIRPARSSRTAACPTSCASRAPARTRWWCLRPRSAAASPATGASSCPS